MLSAQFVGQGSLAIVVRGLANAVCRHDRHDRHNSHNKPSDRSISDDLNRPGFAGGSNS
jgi:hypothetical protein